ncbi:MAG: DUF1223 domain-containing protein [bacterium]|nr:DUF1223 domain-containing protein [bacterium]
MFIIRIVILTFATLVTASSYAAKPVMIASGVERTSLVELYTSEGCSSCPPAEEWLTRLIEDKRLWKAWVPVAFHVDYWDQLGWKDPYGSRDHSQRQRDYAASWSQGRVYTPGFVVNGLEWPGWFSGEALPESVKGSPGVLTVVIEGGLLEAQFEARAEHTKLVAHVALLGFDIVQPIAAGENRGRTLTHDFVVLDHQTGAMKGAKNRFLATIPIELPADANNYAIAAWVTEPGVMRPVQAVGGWLSGVGR